MISIQSQVVHGHVGNSAAVFPMQALGLDVAAVPTTLLSNHPIYPTMRGRVLDAGLVADLLHGLEERGLVEAARAMLTGYLGSAENGAVVADFVARAKARNPGLLYVCDPVIGDEGSASSSREGVVDVFANGWSRRPAIITPNQFELELLAGVAARSVVACCAAVARLGPRRVVVTGCVLADTPAGADRNHRLRRRPLAPNCDAEAADQALMAPAISSPGCSSRISSLGDDLIRAAEKACDRSLRRPATHHRREIL